MRDNPGNSAHDQLGNRLGNLGFPPERRVRKTDEYSSVFAFRRSVRGRYFVLHYRPVAGPARLGLVVARKLARHAVTRNLLKRLAREHFRHILDTLPGHDLALRLAQKTDGATRAQLREDIVSVFSRLPR
jgi:ribonuclease P protein component